MDKFEPVMPGRRMPQPIDVEVTRRGDDAVLPISQNTVLRNTYWLLALSLLPSIAGAFVGTWIGRIFAGENYVAGWIMSVVGAMILLLLYRLFFRRGV